MFPSPGSGNQWKQINNNYSSSKKNKKKWLKNKAKLVKNILKTLEGRRCQDILEYLYLGKLNYLNVLACNKIKCFYEEICASIIYSGPAALPNYVSMCSNGSSAYVKVSLFLFLGCMCFSGCRRKMKPIFNSVLL